MKILILLVAFFYSASGRGSLMGGWKEVDPKELEKEWKEGSSMFGSAVGDIFKALVNGQNSISYIVLHRIVEAKSQLVNGMNYRVTVELGHTDCMRNNLANQELDKCKITRLQTCRAKAYQSFDKVTTVKDINCNGLTRVKRSTDEDEEEARRMAEFAARVLDSNSEDLYRLSVHRVESHDVSRVEDGLKYSMEVELLAKSCAKKAKKVEECNEKESIEEVMTCRFEVVEHGTGLRPELKKYTCDPTSRRHGRLLFREREMHEEKSHRLGAKTLLKMPVQAAFDLFKAEYGKIYSSEEEELKRMKIFEENLNKASFYQDHDSGTATYGASPLSDLTEEEFRRTYVNKEWHLDAAAAGSMKKAEIPSLSDIPNEFDWRTAGAVSSVKNQGSCGSCWAFCVVGNIEGVWAIKHKQLFNLSAQELVDCDKFDMGCEGGLPWLAYTELQIIGGLETDEEYPYHAKEEVCKFSKDKVKASIKGFVNISSDEKEMVAWMVENGPMAIGINALMMQFYIGGISHPWSFLCPKAANHGVVIVGYAIKEGWLWDTPYWIVKNSWGKSWGYDGYYLVYRGSGVCGLNLMVSSAIVN